MSMLQALHSAFGPLSPPSGLFSGNASAPNANAAAASTSSSTDSVSAAAAARVSPATLERELHLQDELMQAFVRSALLRHGRSAFRALVDGSSSLEMAGTVMDESVPLVAHFLFTLELLLTHGLSGKKGWFEEKKGLWAVFEGFPALSHKSQSEVARAFNESVSNFERVSNNYHKARAWIRKALMEKVLSEYLRTIYLSSDYIENYYESYAVFRTEEFGIFLATLQGLNAINFNFIFKDANFDLTLSDITKYIDAFKLSDPELGLHVHQEKKQPKKEPTEQEKEIEELRESLAQATEQNAYLDEVNRHLKASIEAEERKKEKLQETSQASIKVVEGEREQLQNIVIELQERMTNLEEETTRFKQLAHSQSERVDILLTEKTELEQLVLELQNQITAAKSGSTGRKNSGFASVEISAFGSGDDSGYDLRKHEVVYDNSQHEALPVTTISEEIPEAAEVQEEEEEQDDVVEEEEEEEQEPESH